MWPNTRSTASLASPGPSNTGDPWLARAAFIACPRRSGLHRGAAGTGCHTLDSLIEDLRERFRPKPMPAASEPQRHRRYGQKLERRLAAIGSTEAASSSGARGDEIDAQRGVDGPGADRALRSHHRTAEADEETDSESGGALEQAAKNIATLARSSVNLKKFQADAEERARRAAGPAGRKLQEVAKAQGMSAEQVDFWRRDFLGINAP